MQRDANHQPHFTLDSFNVAIADPNDFDGGTVNARGNDGGTNDPLMLFTVTGEVLVRLFGVCETDLVSAGGGTVSVGVTGNTAALLPVTTATDIDVNDLFNDATPAVGTDTLANVTGPHIIVNGLDIAEYTATANITAGQISYICLWRPLSNDGSVVAV